MNFRAAFQFWGVDHTIWGYPYEEKNDPKYVKMIVKLSGINYNGDYFEKIIPHHKCTEEEYAEFYPLAEGQ